MSKNIYMGLAICLILVIFITGGISYIFISNNQENKTINNNNQNHNSNENNKSNNEEKNQDPTDDSTKELIDGIKLINTINENDKIIEEFEVILNGEKKNMSFTFTYKFENNIAEIEGTFNDNSIYFYHLENPNISSKNNLFTLDNIKKEFNENNFKIISGTDNKNYLLLISKSNENYPDELYILNDNLEIIKGDYNHQTLKEVNSMTLQTGGTIYHLENDTKPWYQDELNVCNEGYECHIFVKVEKDKIYCFSPVLIFTSNYNNDNFLGYMEERVYTINNNKVFYETINQYNIIDIEGETP